MDKEKLAKLLASLPRSDRHMASIMGIHVRTVKRFKEGTYYRISPKMNKIITDYLIHLDDIITEFLLN